jgi:putative mycofactocin binding protein MftB
LTVRLESAFAVDPQVAIRPEPFGALCYHYGNRRLTFLKSKDMVAVVEALARHDNVADALTSAGIGDARWPTFIRALDSLEASQVIHER